MLGSEGLCVERGALFKKSISHGDLKVMYVGASAAAITGFAVQEKRTQRSSVQ